MNQKKRVCVCKVAVCFHHSVIEYIYIVVALYKFM